MLKFATIDFNEFFRIFSDCFRTKIAFISLGELSKTIIILMISIIIITIDIVIMTFIRHRRLFCSPNPSLSSTASSDRLVTLFDPPLPS
jgi:hypothetical protein